jgi:hypothetical protein
MSQNRRTILIGAQDFGPYWIDLAGKLAYLAYQGTLAVPEKVKPLPGMFVEYAPVDRDARYYRSLGFENIATFACGINAEYEEKFGPPPVEEFGRILAEEFR